MGMNRTGLAAALSAVALVGLPITVAAPVGAVPIAGWEDPPPATDDPEPAADTPAVVLELVPTTETPLGVGQVLDTDDPPTGQDADEAVVLVTQNADPVFVATQDAGIADLRQDPLPADTEDTPLPENAVPGPQVPDVPSEGGSDTDQASAQNTTSENEPDARSDGSVPTDDATVDSATATESSSADASVLGASAQRSEPLVKTGASSAGILQSGIALLTGGILLVGTGRHRRTRSAESAI